MFISNAYERPNQINDENTAAAPWFSSRLRIFGLKNIRERLEKTYSKGNLLKIEKESNVFRVQLFIPIVEK